MNQNFVFDSSGRLLMNGAADTNAFSGGDDIIIGSTSARSGITLVSSGSNDGGLYFSKGTSSNSDYVMGQIVYQHDNNGGYFRFYTNASERLRITSTGDLSLRSTTQNAYLGLTANSTAINTTLGSTTGTNPRLYLKGVGNGQSDAGDVFIGSGTGGVVQIRSAELIKFEVNSDNSTAEAVTILANGRMGVGTNNPQFMIHTEGSGNNGGVRFDNSHTTTTCLLYTSPSPRDKRQSRMPSSA